jgi:two-component system, response regulator YesN
LIRLLIADDEEDIRLGVSDLIPWEEHGIQIVGTAGDGLEALGMITELKPDILLIDIQMPGLSGLALIRELQHHENLAFVILSGHDEFCFVQEALRLGVEDYLLKPCRPEEILAAVEKASYRLHLPETASQSGILQIFHEVGCEGIDYPAEIEKVLVRELRTEGEDKVHANVTVFLQQNSERNLKHEKRVVCIALLLMEIYREFILQDIPWDASVLNPLGSWKELSEKQLDRALHSVIDSIRTRWLARTHLHPAVRKAKRIIEECYIENLTLQRIANEVNLNPSYLSSQFKLNVGMGISTYINQVRIEHACVLLSNTEQKNYEIARNTGFDNEKYFSDVFKHLMNMSPGSFRKIYLKDKK